jgi:hypothetical protein
LVNTPQILTQNITTLKQPAAASLQKSDPIGYQHDSFSDFLSIFAA